MKTSLLAILFFASVSFGAHADDFCVGESVVLSVSGSHYNVTIKQIYQDGNVDVEFSNGNTSTYSLTKLSHARAISNGISTGDKVVLTFDGSYYNVTVREIYEDDTTLVEFSNGNTSTYKISDLSRSLKSLNGLRVNQRSVLTTSGSHYNVIIKEIYQDGKVLVEFSNGNTSTYDISLLSLELNSLNGMFINDSVVLTTGGSHYNVIIKQIFQDQKVLVEFSNGNTSTYNILLLSKSNTCTSTRDCRFHK
jgi:mRNA-degrading endonuclease HigB of HigAB toxin-antitoxin module